MTRNKRRSLLCPNCSKLISIDEERCPHCGTSRPGSWWKNNSIMRAVNDTDRIVKAVIYSNIAMYIISILLNPAASNFSFDPFSFLSPGRDSLFLLGGTGTVPINNYGRWWTLVSASYLHAGLLHILFNMIVLNQMGRFITREYGVNRAIIIYTVSGIAGYVVSYAAGVGFTIGASAAVCGLIGAALYFGKSRGGTYGQMVYKQVGGWVIGIFYFRPSYSGNQ